MKCLECDKMMEDGSYVCKACKTAFSEEEVELMLRLSKKERKRKSLRWLVAALLILMLLLIGLGVLVGYVGNRVREQSQISEDQFKEDAQRFLRSYEDIENYAIEYDSVMVTIKRESWEMLSENERYSLGNSFQQSMDALRYHAGAKKPQSVIIQINDTEGNVLLYAGADGSVGTYN